MAENYKDTYRFWCTDPYFDDKTRQELLGIEDNEAEIQDRFYQDLEFGTGGLRGILGAGTNRMNLYTVRKATQGLANFIRKEQGEQKGVAIAYDSRRMSPEFAMEAALCLCANGIQTYLFDSLRPTPELSFAVRNLGCISGIVITASHNPPEYNGYKVYWEDGAQITAPKDKLIIDEVKKITDFYSLKTMPQEEAKEKGLLRMIGAEIDDLYIEALKALVVHPDIVREVGSELKIVYTPLHGTGNLPARRILNEIGFQNVYVVPEQELPDGDFPTVSYPNPEDPSVFSMALELAQKVDADLILATDPDADRLGVYSRDYTTGEYHSFTGNMSGILICEYLLSQRKAKGLLSKNGAVVKTIVTSNMADAVAKEYDMKLIQTLTGFKYIGEQIKLFEETNSHTYEFGFEESYGCLIGTHARDKDAIVAVMTLCEAAAFYKKQGISLWEQMQRLYQKYGYYMEGLETGTFKGIEGTARIRQIVNELRENPPKEIGGFPVISFCDYLLDEATDISSGRKTATGLPKSNVLYFQLEEQGWFCVRPSGTEPKVKLYFGVNGTDAEDAAQRLARLKKAAGDLSL